MSSGTLLQTTNSQNFQELLSAAPEYDYFEGLRYKDLGQVSKAVAHFKKALALNTNFFPAMLELALIYEESYQLQKAARLYRRCLEIYPDYYDLLIHYSSCLLRQNKMLEAFKYLRIAEHLEPDLPQALYFRYCAYFYDAQKPAQALRAMLVLREAHPEFVPIYLTIAEIYQSQGNLLKSVIWYRRALRQNPDCKDALLALSAIYGNDFQNRDRAIDYCHRLLELDPADKHARANLGVAMSLPPKGAEPNAEGITNIRSVSPFEMQKANGIIHALFQHQPAPVS